MRAMRSLSLLASIAVHFYILGNSWNWSVSAQSVGPTNLLASACAIWTLGSSAPCEYSQYEILAYREYRRFYIPIPAGANYDLAVIVESSKGDVDVQLLSPDGTVLSKSTERIGDDVVQASRAMLSKNPGNYTLVLQAVAEAESWYSIKIQTASATRLALEDKAVISSIAFQCCPADDDQLPDACSVLLNATAANATDEQDLCLQPPNMCNEQGQLIKLVLSGGDRGNFVCPAFPEELGQLSALQALDWTSNSQVGTLASVAAALSPLAGTLRRLFLGSNALSGPLGCELVNGTSLEVLRLERNLLTGTVPACLFQSPTLRQLSLAGNQLSGTIPPLPSSCALKLLDLSDNGPPMGVSPSNPGIQGTLPSLGLAVNLSYLNVQSNNLTGTIPPLPPGIQVFQAAYNSLTGALPTSLNAASDLRVLDLSWNQLNGTLSPYVTGSPLLTVLRLAGNTLSGQLPSGSWSPFLMDVDLSENAFQGAEFGELLNRSSLIKLNLAANNLTFDMDTLSSKVPVNNSMTYFNISHNKGYGQLTDKLGRMQLFNQLLQAVYDDELQDSLPPQPLFDISYNLINSTFPIKLLPLLAQLYWSSPYDYIPLSLKLQPQEPPGGLDCPAPSTNFPTDVFYLDELQQQYDLTCVTLLGNLINISSFQNVTIPRPPKRPAPPRPPPPLPPRPPVRRTRSPAGANGTADGPTSARPPPPPAPLSGATGSTEKLPSSTSNVAGSDGGGVNRGSVEGSNVNVGTAQPSPPLDGGRSNAPGTAVMKRGGSGGTIAGGVVGGLVMLAIVVVAIWYLLRHTKNRRNAYSSRRVPLTFNSAYEAPSEGTASNYGEMQLFELKPSDRPARHRSRLG